MNIYEIIGAIGLILITIGVLQKDNAKEDIFFIIGGFTLEVYSIYLGSIIFIILEAIVVIAAVVELLNLKIKK